jgi:hypothetical protein
MLNSYNQHKESEQKKDQVFEGIFGKLFGKKEKPSEEQKGLVKRVGPNSYMFGENLVKSTNYAPQDIFSFDWENSQLNFIFKAKFTAEKLNFNLEKEIITDFEGVWEMGPFKGRTFTGLFSGTLFQGGFIGKNSNFKTHPTNFLGGKFSATDKSGILGIPNITQKRTRQKTINLIAIPEKYTLKIISVKGVESFISVVKRLNHSNDDFIYSVTNGYNPQASISSIVVSWEKIRQIYNTNKIKITIGKSTNIADILEIPDGIADLEIIPEGKPIKYSTSFINKELSFDLAKLPLGIQTIPAEDPQQPRGSKVSIFLPDLEYSKGFNKVISNFKNFSMKGDLTRIKDAILNGVVDGYGEFPYLKELFKNIKGVDLSKVTKKDKEKQIPYDDQILYDSMKRLNEFVKYFVNRIVTPGTENLDIQAKNYILSQLRDILAINQVFPDKKQEPKSGGEEKGGGGVAGFIKDLPSLKESNSLEIKKLARKIINDSF